MEDKWTWISQWLTKNNKNPRIKAHVDEAQDAWDEYSKAPKVEQCDICGLHTLEPTGSNLCLTCGLTIDQDDY